MAYLVLVWKSAFRNRLRAALTTMGVALSVIAFLFLRTFIAAFYAGVEAAAADRMVVRNRIAITSPLPISYVDKIRGVRGVEDLTWMSWFGGVYIDERNFFAQFAVDPQSFYRVYPEFMLDENERRAFFADRQGAVAGELLAQKYGWKIGDRITLRGTMYPGDWELTIRGIYRGRDKATDRQQLHFHWKYVDERVDERQKNQVGIVVVRTAPEAGPQVAATIDRMFQSSLAETRTESERAFNLSFIAMSAAIVKAVQVVSFVVLAIILLVLGNTIAMGTRERTSELAVMRAIGFRPRHVIGLVIGEGVVVAALGAALGLALARPVLRFIADAIETALGAFLGPFELSWRAAALAVAVCVAGGVLAAAIPAWRAGRLVIVDALRRTE